MSERLRERVSTARAYKEAALFQSPREGVRFALFQSPSNSTIFRYFPLIPFFLLTAACPWNRV